jgi:DNA-damage-inducible protein D
MNDLIKKEEISFEDFRQDNGAAYWWASDLMKMLGYSDMKSFRKVLDRSTKTCITLGIDHYENFRAETRVIDDEQVEDLKLSRFACYLAVMNGDPKKEAVAAAQVYFVEQTRRFEVYIQNSHELDRVLIRDEIKEGNKALASAAKQAGVVDYARFTNAGYLGMYNMHNYQLAKYRGVEAKELFEHMGRTELAANLFRITQTEEKIKNQNIKGQHQLEKTHHEVGSQVRKLMEQNTGKMPEQLPKERRIPELQKELKKGYKKMQLEEKTSRKKKKH